MIRLFWRLYIPVAVLALFGIPALSLGPILEERFAPVRVNQRIEAVTRTADRLCWIWTSDKVRPRVSDNMDVFIETRTDRSVAAIYEAETKQPWARSRAVGLGPHRQPYCVTLPPSVGLDEPVRVVQTAYYPGFAGLWHVAVHFPDVVDPAGAAF